MKTWTKDKPTAPGHFWVWQPTDVWPCRGQVHLVEVTATPVGPRPGGVPTLRAWVPYMDYEDPLTADTWDGAMWSAEPVPLPEPPQEEGRKA
jgi:hypothetical protein